MVEIRFLFGTIFMEQDEQKSDLGKWWAVNELGAVLGPYFISPLAFGKFVQKLIFYFEFQWEFHLGYV